MTDTIGSEEQDGDLTAGPPLEAPPTGARSIAFRTMDLISRRKEASIAFVLVVLFVYFSVSTPDFLGTDNLRVVGQFTAAVAILAVGQVMLLISGEIDLSLGNIYGMTPFVMWFGTEWGFPLPLAVIFGLLRRRRWSGRSTGSSPSPPVCRRSSRRWGWCSSSAGSR